MIPGRELDSHIANVIFRYLVTFDTEKQDYLIFDKTDNTYKPVPKYSTDLDDSYRIVERMKSYGLSLQIQAHIEENGNPKWFAAFIHPIPGQAKSVSFSTTAAHSICLTALERVNVKGEINW
jgi:hypothetical protein